MKDYSKKTKSKLRELSGIAHERDLGRCLNVVYEHLEAWKAGYISAFEANDFIHKFHDDIARELYKSYVMNDLTLSVAFGVRQGVIGEADIPEEARGSIMEISRLIAGNE